VSSTEQALAVFLARVVLVVIGYLSLEAYLEKRPAVTALRAGCCAVVAVWIDRQVLGESDNAAAVGSVAGIIVANYVMTRRRRDRAK